MKANFDKLKRSSNFELLRIIAMYMIVLHHCTAHGVFSYWHSNATLLQHINNFLCVFLSSGGKIGVTVFVLISGYFLYAQDFKLSRFLKIYLNTFIYLMLFLLLSIAIGTHTVGGGALKASLMPFTCKAYWFISAYLLLYIFSPLLNTILKHTNPKNIRLYLVLATIFWVVCPLITGKLLFYSILIYFFYLYLLGGSIRAGYVNLKSKPLMLCALGALIYFSTNIILHEHRAVFDMWKCFKYMELNTVYTLAVSLYIFQIFSKLKLKNNRFINYISASTFGVYLIHENMFVRPYLWHKIFHVHTLMNDKFFCIEVIAISILVFSACIIFDKIFSKFTAPLISKLINYIDSKKKLPLYSEEQILSNQKS